jgi:hypothetical protein
MHILDLAEVKGGGGGIEDDNDHIPCVCPRFGVAMYMYIYVSPKRKGRTRLSWDRLVEDTLATLVANAGTIVMSQLTRIQPYRAQATTNVILKQCGYANEQFAPWCTLIKNN